MAAGKQSLPSMRIQQQIAESEHMPKISFANKEQPFYRSVKSSVNEYFTKTQQKKTGNWHLYVKTLVLIPLALLIYVFLLAGTYHAIVGILLSVLLGFTLVAIAFNVMHDACHGSYSSRKWVNGLLSFTMNALGSNAMIWKIKHNILHHTYTNIDGLDDDIAKLPVLRLCPTQPRMPIHKYQHKYMFLVYSLSSLLWVYLTDFIKYFSRKIVVTEMKLTAWDHVVFWTSKLLYVFFYAALPIYFVGFWPWLIGYLAVNMTMGLTLGLVFQLAHVVEKTGFEQTGDHDTVLDEEWAVHEIRTTANFAPGNRMITWFVGGLNYQVEHHLFPRISHVHYPAISRIVRNECRKFNLPYHSYRKMTEAIASHYRTMKALGNGQLQPSTRALAGTAG
jgi:linoleoyl-CoA desaturase